METDWTTAEEVKPRYYKDAMHNYMILCSDENFESYQYKMLAANQVDGLLPCSLRFIDEKCFLYYEITSRQSLACLFEKREMSCEEVNILLQEAARMNAKLEEYLLDRERLLLRPEFIFYDFVQEKFYFTYIPGTKEAHEQNAGKGSEAALLEFIADKMENEENGLLGLIYRLCEMAENESFLLTEKTLLDLKKVAYPKTAEEERTAQDSLAYESDERWERESSIKAEALDERAPMEDLKAIQGEYDAELAIKNASYEEYNAENEREYRDVKKVTGTVIGKDAGKGVGTGTGKDAGKGVGTGTGKGAGKGVGTDTGKGAGKGVGIDTGNDTGTEAAQAAVSDQKKRILHFLIGAGISLIAGIVLWWVLDNYILEAEREALCRGGMYLCMVSAIVCSLSGVIMSIRCGRMEKREMKRQEALREEKEMQPTQEYAFERMKKEAAVKETRPREEEIYAEDLEEPKQKLYGMGPWRKYRIALKDFPFTVGQMAGYADYLLEDSSVSRLHARFSGGEKEGTVYMTDLNSLNGTYVNGIRLEPNESIGIHPGDEIHIGKIAFCYR